MHILENIVAEVTFQFWVILDNFGQFWTIFAFLAIFGQFLDNFCSFQYYYARLPQKPYFPHCGSTVVTIKVFD